MAEASSQGYVKVFISPVPDQVAGIQGVLATLGRELVPAAGRRGNGTAWAMENPSASLPRPVVHPRR